MAISQTLIQHFKASSESEACRKLVHQLAPDLEIAGSRVDIFALAGILGIKIIRIKSARYEGKFSWDNAGNETITLAETGNARRERFTAAHEIGHWMLRRFITAELGERFRQCSNRSPDDCDEERLANMVAAEILLPFAATYRALKNQKITCQLVRNLALRFETSRQAVLRRITNLLDTTLIYVVAVPNRFKVLQSRAIIDSALYYVAPIDGLVIERGPVRFLRRISFLDLISTKPLRIGIAGSRGRVTSEFDVASGRKPIPNAELLATGVFFRPL